MAAPCAHAQLRICSYNITSLAGDDNAVREVLEAAHADDKPGFAVPVGLFMFCEVRASTVAALTTAVNNAAPAGYTYALATFTTTSSEDGATGAQAIYYRTDLLAELPAGHLDLDTGGGRKTDRWQFRLQGYDSTAARFYIYGSHLKASTGSANEAERLAGVVVIRNNADALGSGLHMLYTGDMNFYTNSEDGYQEFISAGNGQAFDPYGTGAWGGVGNAIKHTQSPLLNAAGGLVGGGMDDRFDLMLHTAEFADNDGLTIISGTCRSLGNDGAHYNLSINDGNNNYYPSDIPRSNALSDYLFVAADHIPVIVDYKIPAKNSAVIIDPPARVIQNAAGVVAQVRVSNAATGLAVGVDGLDYSVTGSSVLSGVFSGTAPLAPAYAAHNLPVATNVVGLRTGNAQVNSGSEAVQTPSISLPVSLRVLRAHNPSFSAVSDLNTSLFTVSGTVEGEVIEVHVPTVNFGYTVDQALMDVDAATVATAGFSIAGTSGTGISTGSGDVTVQFDPASFGPGTYEAPVTIYTSDENVPGETVASIVATVRVTLTSACDLADFNCDGGVDGADLGTLLGGWGLPGQTDLNSDGNTDGADLGILLGLWG